MDLLLGRRRLSVYSASAVDVLSARASPIPYWPVAWPSGLGLARRLAGLDLRGERILEVGCGVGISGLGAALAGAEVLVTDNEAPALRVAMMNARRNGLLLRAAVADWRGWPLSARFHRVIGSDVTYEPTAFEALLSVLDTSVLPGGEVLLTEPGRGMTDSFRTRSRDAGWSWETTSLPPEGPQDVRLHRLTRP
jgi:predicted nicotinamide N-methyase